MLTTARMYAYLPALDVPRARRFYEGQLGFVPREEQGGVSYEFGAGTACFLYPTSNARSTSSKDAVSSSSATTKSPARSATTARS